MFGRFESLLVACGPTPMAESSPHSEGLSRVVISGKGFLPSGLETSEAGFPGVQAASVLTISPCGLFFPWKAS